jgi:phage terminase large subunit-like protein
MHKFAHLEPLTKAIIRHENGQQPYTDAAFTKGLVLGGRGAGKGQPAGHRTVKGGQAATAATAGLGVVEAVQQTIDPARDALVQGLAPYLEAAKWLLLAVTLIGIGVMLWARIDDHRKGLR